MLILSILFIVLGCGKRKTEIFLPSCNGCFTSFNGVNYECCNDMTINNGVCLCEASPCVECAPSNSDKKKILPFTSNGAFQEPKKLADGSYSCNWGSGQIQVDANGGAYYMCCGFFQEMSYATIATDYQVLSNPDGSLDYGISGNPSGSCSSDFEKQNQQGANSFRRTYVNTVSPSNYNLVSPRLRFYNDNLWPFNSMSVQVYSVNVTIYANSNVQTNNLTKVVLPACNGCFSSYNGVYYACCNEMSINNGYCTCDGSSPCVQCSPDISKDKHKVLSTRLSNNADDSMFGQVIMRPKQNSFVKSDVTDKLRVEDPKNQKVQNSSFTKEKVIFYLACALPHSIFATQLPDWCFAVLQPAGSSSSGLCISKYDGILQPIWLRNGEFFSVNITSGGPVTGYFPLVSTFWHSGVVDIIFCSTPECAAGPTWFGFNSMSNGATFAVFSSFSPIIFFAYEATNPRTGYEMITTAMTLSW